MKRLNFLLLITATTLLQSCYTARPIANLSCLNGDITYANGKQVIKSVAPNFTAFTVFERNETDRLVFDVEFFNTSGQTFTLDPTELYYTYNSPSGKYDPKKKRYAKDPEAEIIHIRKRIAKGYANERNSIAHSVTLSVAEIALATTVAVATDSDEMQVDLSNNSSKYLANEARLDIAHDENEYDRISNTVLRRHTLKNGESIRGKVFFPYDTKATHCFIHYPILGDTTVINYIQQNIDAD